GREALGPRSPGGEEDEPAPIAAGERHGRAHLFQQGRLDRRTAGGGRRLRMQLDPARPSSSLRAKLGAAACTLLATSVPAGAQAAADPRWLLETSALYYGEQARTQIAEPVIRVTRVFSDRRTIALGFTYDAMTGASPTGAQPSATVQTMTTPSGGTTSSGG